jgi:hypothetical protein
MARAGSGRRGAQAQLRVCGAEVAVANVKIARIVDAETGQIVAVGTCVSSHAPPAQNRTCGFPAYGSHLGCVTANDCRMRSSAFDTRAWLWVQCVLCWCAFPLAPALRSTASAAVTGPRAELRQASYFDSARKERIAPFVERPHEIRLGVDRPAFAVEPLSPVGVERKMPDVIVASLLPMLDRQ